MEPKKKVSHYLYMEREPFHISPTAKLYISVSIVTKEIVMIKAIEKEYIDEDFLASFLKEY